MTISPAILDAMLAAGCTAEQIVAAVKADAHEQDARLVRKREVDAARKRRQREKESLGHDLSRGHDVTQQDDADTVSPKKETSPTPPKEKTTPSQSEPNGSSKTPRQALECVLDKRRAGAVIDHRQRIGKPLTAHAAGLLAGKFAECSDPNAAADEMISNGWQGFKPEWLDRQKARGSPSHQPQQKPDHFKAYAEELDGQDRSQGSDSRYWDDAQGVSILTIDYERR